MSDATRAPTPGGVRPSLAAFDLLDAAVFVLDLDLRVRFLNDAAARLYGTSPAAALGRPLDELHEVELLGTTREELHRRLAESGAWRGEAVHVTRAGRRLWVDCSLRRVRLVEGEPPVVVALVWDISAHRQAEEQQRTVHSLFIDASSQGIAIIDEEGRISEWNPASVRLSGIPREEAVGRYYWDVISLLVPPARRSEERRRELERLIRQALATGTPIFQGTREVELAARDGSVYTTIQSVFPIATAQGHRFGTLALDVTEARKAQRERAQLEQELANARHREALGRLAGGVAHDLNNLLTPILGFADLCSRDVAPGHPHHEGLVEITRAAHRARELVQQLLSFGRRQPMQLVALDLNELIRSFSTILRHAIRKNVSVEEALTAEACLVVGDRGQLEQVLLNLALNAQDAMPSGGRLTLATSHRELAAAEASRHGGLAAGRHVVWTVSDTGEGMDEETRARAFEPFFTTKEPGKGTGLGLATAHGLIAQHGGDISVISKPGAGSVFTILLPALAAAPAPSPEATALAPPPRGSGTVLIIEDREEVRRTVAAMGAALGYTALQAASGETALTLAAGRRPALRLLLTDLVLPDTTGPEVFERLRASHPGLAVLYMSGHVGGHILTSKLPAGAALLEKPFTLDDLARKLEESLAPPRPPARP